MFKLPDLPYPSDALSPVLSDAQMRVHHDKHHAKYVENLNGVLAASGEKPATLEEVVHAAFAPRTPKIFNNSAQIWNHAFFWECMTPNGGGAPTGDLNHFASGWAWLVARDGVLEVISTHDADTALVREGVTPLLTCDVWEHAYYVDYKQDRKGFLEQWFDKLVNWPFVEAQFAAAQGKGEGYSFPAPTYS
jgi:Fe-Mn family superoxide dismutase